ncbi:hypothetical protein SeMB42_g05335 [Synchytrium endobioticum]|uniref:Uncharacterized protein n=1 Tax=Synchytrium endobioticum TaxID=286115 RepID=A0A507CS30_9FUNG|nr:hypothetical protein SeMB42_g05335 [Synchytrium endobioticum]
MPKATLSYKDTELPHSPSRYRDWLEADKPEVISTAERECTKSDQETWAEFLECFVISYDIARAYYSTKKYKRKRWDADKARRCEKPRNIDLRVSFP